MLLNIRKTAERIIKSIFIEQKRIRNGVPLFRKRMKKNGKTYKVCTGTHKGFK